MWTLSCTEEEAKVLHRNAVRFGGSPDQREMHNSHPLNPFFLSFNRPFWQPPAQELNWNQVVPLIRQRHAEHLTWNKSYSLRLPILRLHQMMLFVIHCRDICYQLKEQWIHVFRYLTDTPKACQDRDVHTDLYSRLYSGPEPDIFLVNLSIYPSFFFTVAGHVLSIRSARSCWIAGPMQLDAKTVWKKRCLAPRCSDLSVFNYTAAVILRHKYDWYLSRSSNCKAKLNHHHHRAVCVQHWQWLPL